MVNLVSGMALFKNVFKSLIIGFIVFKSENANLSICLWASPNFVNASLALGWGSRAPIDEKTSPNASN